MTTLDFRIGFSRPRSLTEAGTNREKETLLTPDLGRFELINIRTNITASKVNYTRVPLEPCSAQEFDLSVGETNSFFCPPQDLNMTVYGDF